MQSPKAVVFDLGKVLLDFDYSLAVNRMAVHCTLPPAELHGVLNQSTLLHRYETGLMTTNEFFNEVKRLSTFCRGFDDFAPIFGDIFTAIPEMIELNRQLRVRHIPTYIFSNTNELAVTHIRRVYPFFSDFDSHIYSFEHRAMKPDPRIYKVVEAKSGREKSNLLYIDDRLENIQAGEARGWRTIHHKSAADTIARVKSLGLLG
jgi:FMN phosphatase YigB (HAD superfamily)